MSEIPIGKKGENEHPIIRVIRTNPLMVIQICMVAFGGGIVWNQISTMRDDVTKEFKNIEDKITDRVHRAESRVTSIELALREASVLAAAKDDRATMKIESVQRELSAARVDIGRIESSLQFLVRQERSKATSQ